MPMGRITSRTRFIDCQLLLLLLIVIEAVMSSGMANDTSTSSSPGAGILHHETITSFAIGKTTMLHVSTTDPTSPQSTAATPPPATSGGVSAVTHVRVEVQQPPSTITEVTTGSTGATTTKPEEPATSTQPETASPTTNREEAATSSRQEGTSSYVVPEITSANAKPEEEVMANNQEQDPATTGPTPDPVATDSTGTRGSEPEATIASQTAELSHESATTISATEPDRHARTTTTATEAETYTTSVVSSAPSPGTISSSSEFATSQQQQRQQQQLHFPANNTNDTSPTTPTARGSPIADIEGSGQDAEQETTPIATSKPPAGSSRRRIVPPGKNVEPKTTSTTTSTEAPPRLIDDDVLNIDDIPTVSAELQPFSVIEIGSGSVGESVTSEDAAKHGVIHFRPSPDVDTKSTVQQAAENHRDITAESNDVSDVTTTTANVVATWFVLVLEGNCSLIARGRQGQGERGFKNQVLENAAHWLSDAGGHDDVTVTDFHCSSPDRIRANLTVLQRPSSSNVSSRLASLEESREAFMRYHGQDFFVYQIITADGYLNKEPDLPPVVDLQHSNVELVIYIASGSTCAFLVLLAIALLACKYWGRGGTQKPFDFSAVNSTPAADQLTNMRLEDYTLTRIPRPRIGHVQDYYYRGLHAKRNYAPLTDAPARPDKMASTAPGMVRASDTSVVPLEDDTVSASGFRDGVIVRPMDIRQNGQQQQHYRQLLGGSLGRLYRGARRSAGRTASSKLATVIDADGFRVRSTENLHSMSAVRSDGRAGSVGVPEEEEEEEEKSMVERGMDNPNYQ